MGMSNRARFVLDVGLFVGLLLAFFPANTGISVHEWLSLAIVAPALFHLIVNWDWVVHSYGRLLGKLKTISLVNLTVDTALFISTVTVVLSGFMISQVIAGALDVIMTASVAWHVVHSFAAKLTIVLMLVHLGLHWRWVTSTVTKLVAMDSPTTATESATTSLFNPPTPRRTDA